MEALILAGGEGTRMSRITAHVPKPLLYLPGGTFLEYQMALLARLPLSRVLVITRYRERRIEEALGKVRGVTLVPQEPPPTLLGALATAEGHVRELCIVLHGDNYFSHELGYLADAARSEMTSSGCQALFVVEPGQSVGSDPERLSSTGCYLLRPALFAMAKALRGCDQLSALTRALVDSGVVLRELALRGWRQNINEPGHLLATSRRMLANWGDSFHPPQAEAGYNRADRSFEVEPPVWVSPQAEVADSLVGPLAVVGPGARVRGCLLREAIVFPGAEVEGQEVVEGIVLPGSQGCLVLTAEGDVSGGHGS